MIEILTTRSSTAKLGIQIVVFHCGPGFHEAWVIDNYGEEPITEFLKASSKPELWPHNYRHTDKLVLTQLQWAIHFTWIISLTLAKISILL